jgi:hypothetical protein
MAREHSRVSDRGTAQRGTTILDSRVRFVSDLAASDAPGWHASC